MTLQSITFFRNFLLKTFVIGFVFALILGCGVIFAYDWWMPLAVSWLRTDPTIINAVMMELFMTIRFYLVFVVLAPGLALHWMLKSGS